MHPFEACAQLFQALRGNDGMAWEDAVFQDLNDVVIWLCTRADTLDQEIDRMFGSKRFEAWLAYQGLENILEESPLVSRCPGGKSFGTMTEPAKALPASIRIIC